MAGTSSCTRAGKAARPLLAAALMLLLAGCDSGVNLPDLTTRPTATPLPTQAQPRSGGSVSLPISSDAVIGNPLLPCTRELRSVYGLIFESLVEFSSTGTAQPCLAASWQENPDAQNNWVFTLRSGIKWQRSGKAFSAADVVYTLDQIKSLGKNNPYYYVTDYIKAWQANQDGTLTLQLNKKPFYGALQALAFPVIPKDAGYDEGAAPDVPVGTGAYRLTSKEEGKSITLGANPDWWRKQPYLSKITLLPYPDTATQISSLVLRTLDAVQTDDLTVTQYRDSGNAKLYEYQTNYFEYMAVNFTTSDLKDKRMRQAIAYAMDRREIVSYTYVNHATIADSPVPQGTWLFDGKQLKYNNNVEQARSLIKLAGWKDNFKADGTPGQDGYWDTDPAGIKRDLEFRLIANKDNNNTLRSDAAGLIASQLDKAGIKVTVQSDSWDVYSKNLSEKRFDLAMCGCYLPPVPDYTFLLGSAGARNVGGYSDPDMDALLDSVLSSSDSSALKVNIGALQALVVEQLPIISLYFRTHSLLYSPDLMGVRGVLEDNAYAGISQWYRQ